MTRFLTAGPFRLDLKDERLFRDDEPLKLSGKPLLLLRALMERPKLLVTKEELITLVWDSRAVSDSVITTAVKELRIAVGDDARNPEVIETAHGRGYRFLMDVTRQAEEAEAASPSGKTSSDAPDQPSSALGWVAAAGGLFVLVLFGVAFLVITAEDQQTASDLAATPAATPVTAVEPPPVSEADPKSIAVLPFIDLSADGDQDWFTDGLSEELIHSLARTPDLRVTSRSTSFQYKGDGIDLMDAARQMGVAHILEGSVRRGEDRVRVTAQLIRASDGFHLWSQNYDREYADVISIQEDIAFEIATALKTVMDPEKLRVMVEAGTRSVAAYEALLEGHFVSSDLFNPSGEGIRKTTYDMYEEARTLDPGFAEAHWRAARAWLQRFSVFALPPEQTDLTADEIAQNFIDRVNAAIETSADPVRTKFYQASLAEYRLQFREALAALSEYLAEQPNDVDMQIERIKLATYVGDYDTARTAAQALVDWADKTNPEFERTIPNLIWSRDFQAAKRQALRAIELAPFDSYIRYQAHRALMWAGDFEGARVLIPEIEASQLPPVVKVLTNLRQACADGDTATAAALANQARSQGNVSFGIQWIIAMIMNEQDEAYTLIEPLDQREYLQQLSEFMLYPHFDSSRFPVLSAALKADFIDRPAPTPLPFACS